MHGRESINIPSVQVFLKGVFWDQLLEYIHKHDLLDVVPETVAYADDITMHL